MLRVLRKTVYVKGRYPKDAETAMSIELNNSRKSMTSVFSPDYFLIPSSPAFPV